MLLKLINKLFHNLRFRRKFLKTIANCKKMMVNNIQNTHNRSRKNKIALILSMYSLRFGTC